MTIAEKIIAAASKIVDDRVAKQSAAILRKGMPEALREFCRDLPELVNAEALHELRSQLLATKFDEQVSEVGQAKIIQEYIAGFSQSLAILEPIVLEQASTAIKLYEQMMVRGAQNIANLYATMPAGALNQRYHELLEGAYQRHSNIFLKQCIDIVQQHGEVGVEVNTFLPETLSYPEGLTEIEAMRRFAAFIAQERVHSFEQSFHMSEYLLAAIAATTARYAGMLETSNLTVEHFTQLLEQLDHEISSLLIIDAKTAVAQFWQDVRLPATYHYMPQQVLQPSEQIRNIMLDPAQYSLTGPSVTPQLIIKNAIPAEFDTPETRLALRWARAHYGEVLNSLTEGGDPTEQALFRQISDEVYQREYQRLEQIIRQNAILRSVNRSDVDDFVKSFRQTLKAAVGAEIIPKATAVIGHYKQLTQMLADARDSLLSDKDLNPAYKSAFQYLHNLVLTQLTQRMLQASAQDMQQQMSELQAAPWTLNHALVNALARHIIDVQLNTYSKSFAVNEALQARINGILENFTARLQAYHGKEIPGRAVTGLMNMVEADVKEILATAAKRNTVEFNEAFFAGGERTDARILTPKVQARQAFFSHPESQPAPAPQAAPEPEKKPPTWNPGQLD